MPSQKRDRQWVSSRAKAAAAEAARRRKRRKRLGAALLAGVLVIALGGTAVLTTSGSGSTVTAADPNAKLVSSTTDTTAPALPSAAGKPCVALADPLPPGAPNVPVKVGPPPTDLVSEDLKVGEGAVVTATNTVSVNYVGVSCSTGAIFDDSPYTSGQPASIPLSNVLPGWQQGVPGMKVGGQRLLGIPPALAYGPQGRGNIAPDETLWFVIEVLSAT